ncbi:hypothetical protein V6N12_015897 [Hibiscus sabdariffa]|uniref:Transmembrane 9 superfamily member n=1 Tax=Hibiscus sabdariffa TaxID=183260 RepID=A0ABR2DPI4_9ROSI
MCHWFSVELVTSLSGLLQESDIKWASRWDTYLVMNDDQIHWFSIVNSLMIVLFLSGMIAMIMMRTFPTTISVQIFSMTLVTMIFDLMGFLSPSNRGGLMTAMVLFYLGFKRPAIEDQQNSRADTRAGMVYDGSILPFEAVFIELSFILTLIWLNQLCYATSSCAVKTIIGGRDFT